MPPSLLRIYLPYHGDCSLASSDRQFVDKFKQHNFAHGRAVEAIDPSDADLIVIFQECSFKLPSYIQDINKSDLFRKFAEKIYVVNYDDVLGEGFLPGTYTSLSKSVFDAKRFSACAYPKAYNEHISSKASSDLGHDAQYLFSFRGTSKSNPIRTQLFAQLSGTDNANIVDVSKAFHSHTEQDKTDFVVQMKKSTFVLCPRGWSPNTYRLYEAMSIGRCPVIISDEWVATDGPDWSRCSIRVAEKDISLIPKILENRHEQGPALGKRAQQEWLKHFDEPAKYRGYLDQITRLHTLDEKATMSVNEYNAYWRSKKFLRNNGWTLKQRVMRKLNLSK
jgi:hypothetical protein